MVITRAEACRFYIDQSEREVLGMLRPNVFPQVPILTHANEKKKYLVALYYNDTFTRLGLILYFLICFLHSIFLNTAGIMWPSLWGHLSSEAETVLCVIISWEKTDCKPLLSLTTAHDSMESEVKCNQLISQLLPKTEQDPTNLPFFTVESGLTLRENTVFNYYIMS